MEVNRPQRLLIVSHPAVVVTNQAVFAELAAQGFDVHLVTPRRWRNEYARGVFAAPTDPALHGRHTKLPVFGAGKPQRHLYLFRVAATLRKVRPDVIYLEEECFSLPAAQWAFAAKRRGIPFGLQAWENLDRPLPWPIKKLRSFVLRACSFVVARTPAAKAMVEQWGTSATVKVVGSPVASAYLPTPATHDGFVIGGAGRLVEQKGFGLVAEAVKRLPGASLRLAGDGPLRSELEDLGVEVVTTYTHETMPEFFRSVDVLVLFSVPTSTWAEQFGRVLVEALAQEIPVIGSTCGEIPWVIATTGGGIVVEHGDFEGLVEALTTLSEDPDLRQRLGASGRKCVEEHFSVLSAAYGLVELARLQR